MAVTPARADDPVAVMRQCADGSSRAEQVRGVLDRIGDKWSLLIIGTLTGGPMRFGVLARSIQGISERMLTQSLKRLERDGLVTRTAYPEIPPRVEYELTKLGASLLEPARALAEWAVRYGPEVEENRRRFDALAR